MCDMGASGDVDSFPSNILNIAYHDLALLHVSPNPKDIYL